MKYLVTLVFAMFAAVVLMLLFCPIVKGEDIILPEVPQYAETEFPKIRFETIGDVPYDFAKHMPPERYYWWALSHNKRVQSSSPAISEGVTSITSQGNAGINLPARHGHASSTRVNYKTNNHTQIRTFRQTVGREPVMIYNPYFR